MHTCLIKHRFMYILSVVLKPVLFKAAGVSEYNCSEVVSCVGVVRAYSSECVTVCDACS